MFRSALVLAALLSGAASAAAAQPAARCAAQPERCITVTFRDTDVRDVVTGFARFSGRSVVIGPGVAGRVNAEIRDQPWDEALRAILNAHGLDVVAGASGILRVESLSALRTGEVQTPLVTRVFRLSYVPVDEVYAAAASLRSERGRVTASASTNSLVVHDTEAAIARIAQVLGHR